jgi:hypothetical protein
VHWKAVPFLHTLHYADLFKKKRNEKSTKCVPEILNCI